MVRAASRLVRAAAVAVGVLATTAGANGAAVMPATTTTSPSPSPVPEHRIGVRVGAAGGELYDRTTGTTFVARGFNHWQWAVRNGNLMDATFRVGGGGVQQARADLAAMASYGYNTVRIWINACWDGAPDCLVSLSGQLQPEYLEHVAEYLRVAKEHGIFVIFTTDDLNGPHRYDRINRSCCDDFVGFNLLDLTSDGIEDQRQFWTDFVGGLVALGAPTDAVLAYELRNEQFFESQLPPFTLDRPVTTANGQTYDMRDPDAVAAMMHEGRAHWARTLSAHIKSIDPTALVAAGFFMSGQGPVDVGGDPRLVDPRGAVPELDLVDFHHYPGLGPLGWDDVWANSLLRDAGDTAIILGEFGAFHEAFDTIDKAVTAQTQLLSQACGAGLDGYLGWVWANQGIYDETWPAVGDDGDDTIAAALSPIAIPDPCHPPPPRTGNLAYEKPVSASRFEDTSEFTAPPRNAVDGSDATWWTADDVGPQWIEIDLVTPATVGGLRMFTDLAVELPVQVDIELLDEARAVIATHRFESAPTPGSIELVHHFDPPVAGVRFARATTHRDGWVIWNEIEVLAGG